MSGIERAKDWLYLSDKFSSSNDEDDSVTFAIPKIIIEILTPRGNQKISY